MTRCWMLYRVLTFSTGETIALPLEGYESSDLARQAKHDRDRAFSEALELGRMRVGELSEQFPVSELIQDLGIHAISHAITEVPVKGAEILKAEPSIIIPAGSRH